MCKWQLFDQFKLLAYLFDEEWIIYHSGSGETHRLSVLSSYIFSIFWVNNKQVSIIELIDFLFKEHQLKMEKDQVKQILTALEELNLIQVNNSFELSVGK